MKFTINDQTYFVKWFYLREEIIGKTITECAIYIRDGLDNQNNHINKNVALGYAHLSKDDIFNKNIGRKLSLRRALQKLFPYATTFQQTGTEPNGNIIWNTYRSKPLYKEYREIAWKEYFNESPKRLNV